MNEIHKKYRSQGLKVIAVNLDTEIKDAREFLKNTPADFSIAYDPQGTTPEKYKLSVMPTSYLIDRKGRIIDTHKGFKDSTKDVLESKIKKALVKK